MRRGTLTAVLAGAVSLLSVHVATAQETSRALAQAGTGASFVDATCGTACADPVGEEASARQNWSALSGMGTTQWVGSSVNGSTVDASALLGAARVAGASELDRWLRTGSASDPSVATMIVRALSSFGGFNVQSITGGLTGLTSGSGLTSLASAGLTGTGGSLSSTLATAIQAGATGSSVGCDPSIASAQTASAQNYVNNMQTIATSQDLGFSQLGGNGIASGQRSASGYFGGSCIDGLVQGARDLLFKPPGLSSLLSQLGSMFGSGSGAGCASAPTIMAQIQKSLPSGIFGNTGLGGFFPALAGVSSPLDLGSMLNGLGGSNLGGNLTSLIGRATSTTGLVGGSTTSSGVGLAALYR